MMIPADATQILVNSKVSKADDRAVRFVIQLKVYNRSVDYPVGLMCSLVEVFDELSDRHFYCEIILEWNVQSFWKNA